MIKLEHLTRCYGDLTAVNDVSFEIDHGEVVGLLGHNGAGKTTIMKMVTGYLEPTSGHIEVDGLDVEKDSRAVARKIGYLPENCPVWPEMTVIEYLEYMANLHGVPDDARQAAIAKAIRRTDLKSKATAQIQTLSRGYRQRVGVAQAILHNPDIIILDEPTNGLDPTQIRHMRDLIGELSEHATVIVSTHILQEVQAVCERALIMRAGKLVIDSRLDALQKSAGIVLAVGGEAEIVFRGIPDISEIRSHREEDGLHHYVLDASPDLTPVIAEAITRQGLSLHMLQPHRRDLETVFAEVNGEVVHG